MPSPATASSYNLGRSLWPQTSIYDLLLKESPLLGKLQKDTTFAEDIRYIAVGTSAPQGVAWGSFQTAKANKSASIAKQFQITAKTLYAAFSIEGRLMRKAKYDKALIVKPYARESRNAINQWKRDCTAALFGNGGGAIGQISTGSSVSAQYITLADTSKVRFFDEGMVLQLSTADGTTGAVKPGTVTVQYAITSGSNKGRVYVSEATWDTGVPTAATSDYIFREGSFGNTITGLAGWIPATAPTTTFMGQDRTNYPEKLGGLRISGVGKTPLNAALEAAAAIHDSKGAADLYVLSTSDWQNLRNDLSGSGNLIMQATPASGVGSYKAGMSYQAIKIQGPSGVIDVIADPDCPVGTAWMLMSETWTLASTGELVSLIESPMMEDASDAWESRFVGDIQLYCEAPLYNATIALA